MALFPPRTSTTENARAVVLWLAEWRCDRWPRGGNVLRKPWAWNKNSQHTIQQDQRINGGVQRMVTHKRGTVAWLFTATVLFAFSTLAIAQNESGYTSKYLANTHLAKLKSNPDNARAREEAMK